MSPMLDPRYTVVIVIHFMNIIFIRKLKEYQFTSQQDNYFEIAKVSSLNLGRYTHLSDTDSDLKAVFCNVDQRNKY